MKSIAVVLASGTGRVRIDINSDGKLSWKNERVDEALEYDIAFAAMGGSKSKLLDFVDLWNTNIREAMFGLLPTRKDKALFAMDCAEHVVEVHVDDDDWHEVIFEVVKHSRDFISGLYLQNVKEFERRIKWISRKIVFANLTDAGGFEDALLGDIVTSALWSRSNPSPGFAHWRFIVSSLGEGGVEVYTPATVSVLACDLAGAMSSRPKPGPRNTRWRKEKAWQIHRFVDVLTAIRGKQPWPGLEETP